MDQVTKHSNNKIKEILTFILTIIVICFFTAINQFDFPFVLDSYVIYICLAVIVVIAIAVSNRFEAVTTIKGKIWLQILEGISLSLILALIIGVIPILLGQSLIGNHEEYSSTVLFQNMFLYLILVGPVEELIFRGYIQSQVISWLPKHKWLGPLLAALLFGLWHIINGSLIQVVFTFFIGMAFGYAQYFVKHFTLLSSTISHGIYDFILSLLRMFML
jgi:membrane protease YdiL (CAAX protease family)